MKNQTRSSAVNSLRPFYSVPIISCSAVSLLPPDGDTAHIQTWRYFRDVNTADTSFYGDQLCGDLEKVISWRLGQDSSPVDTMQNWTNYWTVRVNIKSWQRPLVQAHRFILVFQSPTISLYMSAISLSTQLDDSGRYIRRDNQIRINTRWRCM